MTTSLRTLGATLLAFLALGATAWAYLGTTGGGQGTGTASGRPTVVIDAGNPPVASLLPTDEWTGDVTVQLDNKSGAPLAIGAIVLDTSRGDGGFGTEGVDCKVAFRAQGPRTLNAGINKITLVDAMKMDTTAPNKCQGLEIRVFVKATS